LAITGWELVVVVGVLAVIFLWGPNKIPELARSIGQARGEFEKAKKELTTLPTRESDAPATATKRDDPLIAAARELGIPTEGKTRDAISKEIVERATAKKTAAAMNSPTSR
jgi:sec-independent protein translocase protein TatA